MTLHPRIRSTFPKLRPLRARRVAAAVDEPLTTAPAGATPRWVVVGTGVLGALVTVEAVIGLAVIW